MATLASITALLKAIETGSIMEQTNLLAPALKDVIAQSETGLINIGVEAIQGALPADMLAEIRAAAGHVIDGRRAMPDLRYSLECCVFEWVDELHREWEP